MEKVYLTSIGYDKLIEELKFLKEVRRPKVIEDLKEARSLGDLSENAEYDAARGEQAEVEGKIKNIEWTLEDGHFEIIKEGKKDVVSVGSTIEVEYVEDAETEKYTIVGSKEADPFENKISNESPIAKAVLGSKVGDTVCVDSPNGKYELKVLNIL